MFKKEKNQKGVSLIIVFLILVVIITMVLGLTTILINKVKILGGIGNASLLYYASESGIENALLKLKNDFAVGNYSATYANYTLDVNGVTTTISISPNVGGSRTIDVTASNVNGTKTIEAVYAIDSDQISFHYGAQVGAGGLTMGSNSQVVGNVFSSGNITGPGTITGTVIAANSSIINGIHVGQDATAYSCQGATIGGVLTLTGGSSSGCGSLFSQSSSVPDQNLPISQTQIDDWKAETADGTPKASYTIGSNQTVTESSSVVITGNMSVGSNATWNLMGTTKIIGNLTVGSNSHVNISGTLYVTGIIGFGSGSTTQLASSYGSLSGVIISDGIITVNSNATLQGTGQSGSYMMAISTSSSNSAIGIGSNGTGAIFYTSIGGVQINSNANLREVTGYKVSIGSNATLTYESGLANLNFSSGPGGSWQIVSWLSK